MADIKATIQEGEIKGEVEIWPGILGGILTSLAVLGIFKACSGDDDNSGTFQPNELEVVEFQPDEGTLCKGLRPYDAEEVIASTIICEFIED